MESARVLVCEDERIFALDLKARIEDLGHRVIGIASNADEALAIAMKSKPDIALMDIRLEGSTPGTDVALAIKEELNIPSIFLTAFADSESIDAAKRSAPLGYLIKPVGDSELRTALEMGISLHEKYKRQKDALSTQIQFLKKILEESKMSGDSIEKYKEKLAALQEEQISTLSEGIAHHLNNSLTSVVMSLDWIKQCGTIPEFELRFVKNALAACDDISTLIRYLMWSSGKSSLFYQSFDLKNICGEAVSHVQAKLGSRAKIFMRTDSNPLPVVADHAALLEAIEQLLQNACEAIGEAGEVMVTTLREHHQNPQDYNPEAQTGWYGIVRVRDTGPGMDLDIQDHATDPFFSLSPNPNRLGLGLSVARGVSQALGGWLDLSSEVNKGTDVKLYVPLHEAHSTEAINSCSTEKKLETVDKKPVNKKA